MESVNILTKYYLSVEKSDFSKKKNTRKTMLRGFCNETNLSITSTQSNLCLMSSSSNGLSEQSSVQSSELRTGEW